MSENDIEKIRASKIDPIVEAYKEAQEEANSPLTFAERIKKKQEQNNQIAVSAPNFQ